MSDSQNAKLVSKKAGMYSFGLIGYPLGYSFSPQIHGAALYALGISGEYLIYAVPPTPAGQSEIAGLLTRIRKGEIHGLNVTIPHKQNVIPLLDELTSAAQTIGAVNTIYLRDGVLVGDNTDAPGFWGDLHRQMVTSKQAAKTALVLGSGGGARAVVYALLIHGYHVTISARCEDQAQAEILKNDLSVVSDQIEIICLETDYGSITTDHFSVLVNCTPVGQHPHEDVSPWPDEMALPKNATVYDLVYNPRETLLVKQAQSTGLTATTGLGMLIEQAALAFELWTGVEAPRNVMMNAVNFE